MTYRITIRGLVQGVGFRPFIYLLAKEMGIKGKVSNRNNGVMIDAEFSGNELQTFMERIRSKLPPVAHIHSIETEEIADKEAFSSDFSIEKSRSESDEITQIAPDIAVCADCLNDRLQQPHRLQYPFINCTHCGPRFSIIRDLPYDRDKTTMATFEMCPVCKAEYQDITDRRFHAQPIACNHCGPVYKPPLTPPQGENSLPYGGRTDKFSDELPLFGHSDRNASLGREVIIPRDAFRTECNQQGYPEIIEKSVQLLNAGKVIAVKGIGGYHLICDATNEQAVSRLRAIKERDTKPFAVMFRDIASMSPYVLMNEAEKECLQSWRRPIVLLPLKEKGSLTSQINPGMRTLGCMLPYMPIHYDWFERLDTNVLVMTSGNLNDRPIIIDPEEADKELGGKVDWIIHHNRPIYNRVDDSVVQFCGEQMCLLRRSRGYVPEPFFTDIDTEGIIAFGAEKTNTFALGKADTIIQSQHIGDLKNAETLAFYTESLQRFRRLFRFTPQVAVCDLHPDYLSSVVAEQFANEHFIPLIKVQHHHAHAVACMTEYAINEEVLAIVWDGTGLGDDGNSWGGEFLLCNRQKYKRLSHIDYVAMPGGDRASDEPWRMTVAYAKLYGLPLPDDFTARIGKEKIAFVSEMIDKQINTPLTSGAGRLFDAFSSLLGICDFATRQAEAAQMLEQVATDDYNSYYQILSEDDSLSVRFIFEGAIHDINGGLSTNFIAAKIHNTLAHLILEKSTELRKKTKVSKVLLSGGCFQNKRLTEHLQRLFREKNIPLFVPSQIPCNDAGVSVGQLVVAAEKLKEKIYA